LGAGQQPRYGLGRDGVGQLTGVRLDKLSKSANERGLSVHFEENAAFRDHPEIGYSRAALSLFAEACSLGVA
jgi:hypothetical protein